MNQVLRQHACILAFTLAVTSLLGGSGTAQAAAGAPPTEAIAAPKTGAELKHACGQGVDGYSELVGEIILRYMLVSQCRAAVAAIVDLVNSGQYEIDGTAAWQCVENRDDRDALAATFVTWVGRRPALLRKPASLAFIEAIEMSEKCR